MIKPLAVWQRFALTLDDSRPGFATGPWFTMNAVVDIRGPLDVRRLDQAVQDLVDRHDLLRTRVRSSDRLSHPDWRSPATPSCCTHQWSHMR
jgi:hypothetical protein